MMRIIRWASLLTLVVGVVSLSCGGFPASFRADTCKVTAMSPRRLLLQDSSTISVDASTMVRNGNSILILGSTNSTTVWAKGAGINTLPIPGRPKLGVILGESGEARLVLAPKENALYARAASAGREGWHVIFITVPSGNPTNTTVFDSASVWYGLFDGSEWQNVKQIASARSASLVPGMSSDLLSVRNELAFAYPYDRAIELGSNASGNQGLVLLKSRDGKWYADTLPTWEGPRSVQLVPRRGNLGIEAVFAQSYFTEGRPQPLALFTADYDTGWSNIRMRMKLDSQHIRRPIARMVGSTKFFSWQVETVGVDTEIVEWGIEQSDSVVRKLDVIGSLNSLDQYAAVSLETQILWLIRKDSSHTELRAFVVGQDTVLHDAGIVRLPFNNVRPLGLRDSKGDVVVLTIGLAQSESDPPAASYLTTIVVRCLPGRSS